jgi:hypothetical protein
MSGWEDYAVTGVGLGIALTSHSLAASFDTLTNDFLTALGASLAFFFSVSLVCGRILSKYGWKINKSTRMINSALVSLCHGGVAIYFSAIQLSHKEYQLGAPNETAQLQILAYSAAYFFTDFVFLVVYMPEEKIYIIHHLIVLLYIQSVVYTGFGTFSCMALMFFGEVTNPLHNIRHIIEEVLKTEKPPVWASAAKRVVWPIFNLSYATFRLGISPFVIGHVVWFFITGQSKNIPYPVGISWAMIALTVLGGSIGPGLQCIKSLAGSPTIDTRAGSPKAGKAA